MDDILIFPKGSTEACARAAAFLKCAGIPLTDHPCPEATHLLLDVPSFSPRGALRGGGSISQILEMLPQKITVIGGNLNHSALSGYRKLDLLQDPEYLAENASITAHCAIQIAASMLPVVLPDAPCLIIGWGRIGQCLAKLLTAQGCPVTISSRRPESRAMAGVLGMRTVDIPAIPSALPKIRLIFNTAPAPILPAEILDRYRNCLKIDLASAPGLAGSDIVYARGLPGQYAPESSGRCITQTILKSLKEAKS